MGAIADIFTGGSGAVDAAREQAAQIQFDPRNIRGGGLGSVSVGADGTISLGESQITQQFGGQLADLAQGLFGEVDDPSGEHLATLDALFGGLGRIARPQSDPRLGQQVGANFAAAGAARDALGNFDPNAFAATQFDRLNALARPGETTAAQSEIERLYGTGRLGVRQGGQQRELAELATAQEMGRNQRGLQALQLAGQEQSRLAQQAGMFSQLGSSLSQAGFGQDLAGAQFGAGQNQFFGNLGMQRFGAAQSALASQRGGQQQQIASILQLLGGTQGLQQSPLALLGHSIGAGAQDMQASNARAGLITDAEAAAAAARGQFFGGLASAAGNAFTFGA